jgi:peptidoglycan/xylan/chitin deacetylase (PgdA/CDA1 family)
MVLALSGVAALVLVPTSGAAEAAPRPCSLGLVALTFDDGPASGLTPELVDVLTARHVPATFFMVGERINSAPAAARRVAAGGFGIANHTYHHEQLTRLSNDAIRATLRRTRQAADDAGVPMSRLMRPPYGAVNARVRSVLSGMGVVPVLWTVDPGDWRTGRTTDAIASSVLAQLRPHRTNIVLQHDGVANSPRSVAALPRIIRTARARGYCFARLGPGGTPVPPVPAVSVSDAWVAERTGSRSTLAFTVRLNQPTSRATSVLVSSADGGARAGIDYVAQRIRVGFPVGVTRAVVRVPVLGDKLDEATESVRLRLSAPRGLTMRRTGAQGVIRDDDAPPVVGLVDSSVTEPATASLAASVSVRLSRPSGRTVSVQVHTVVGTADTSDFTAVATTVTFAAGTTSRQVDIPVLADDLDEPAETFELRTGTLTNATLGDGTAHISIVPRNAT